jgi:LuxR family transcriptional regulator, quorum-sensing system regulator BjaR1
MMSELRTTIVETVEEIGRASTPDAVWKAIKTYAEAQGFQYMLVVKGKHSVIDSVSGCALYSDMPQGFGQSFDDLGFSKNNPLISHALKEARPYSAAELWAMPLTVQQRRALAQVNLSLNVLDGLMIPIRNADVLEGIVLLGGAKPEMAPIIRSTLHLLAYCAFEQVIHLLANPRRASAGLLSPREVECLSWAAAGKTDGEIGRILSISPRTTRFHIENAKKKLGVATRVQAVAEAMKRKAIAA